MRGILTIAIGCALAAPAAAVTSQTFAVSADIVTGCLVTVDASGYWGKILMGTVAGVQTGTVSANLVANAATGVQVSCTPGTTLSATADTGSYAAGGNRQLGLPGYAAARIPYQLYANNSATPWTTQAVALSFPVGTQSVALPIKGTATLPGIQRAGAYADTVRVTLSW